MQVARTLSKSLTGSTSLGESKLTPPGSSLEIACYNGPKSHILVGSAETIASVDSIIKLEPQFQALKHERLDTSRGYHSVFTKPILIGLDKISTSLTWNKPKIPLETCTQEKIELFTQRKPSSHMRESVYFVDAVRRIERSLGPCAWLEAGVDTGIISLVKTAVERPEQGSFHALNTKGPSAVNETVSQAVILLWREGLICTDWNSANYRPVWLPPYQFQGPDIWLPNIDRAAKIQSELLEPANPDRDIQCARKQPRLIVPMSPSAGDADSRDFSINTSSERFKNAVSGHAVCGRPLCPAGMYMECATMALQYMVPDFDTACLKYKDIRFKAALGIDQTRHVKLTLDKLAENQSWSFHVRSSLITEITSQFTEHASGTISLLPSNDLTIFQRLISDNVRQLRGKSDIEMLHSGRAYRLFSRVVDYGSFFRGISTITMDDQQAFAKIKIPDIQPHCDESTVLHICDAMVIDSFVQTLGLLINSSDAVVSEPEKSVESSSSGC